MCAFEKVFAVFEAVYSGRCHITSVIKNMDIVSLFPSYKVNEQLRYSHPTSIPFRLLNKMPPHLMFEKEAVGEFHFQLISAASVRVIEQAFSTQQPASLHFPNMGGE